MPTLERATKFNPMFESDPVTAQYYRRYDDNIPQYSSSTTEWSSDEMRHVYQNTAMTEEVCGGAAASGPDISDVIRQDTLMNNIKKLKRLFSLQENSF